MPKPIRTSRRAWCAAWVVLCAAGLAATAGLNASSAPDPQPERSVSAECAECVADIETQLAEAKAEQEGEGDGVLAFSRVQAGTGDDCRDELRDHLRGDR
ncbi:membrane protein [Streptomyces atrovirens]|uniref:Secreted protein n=1 Tax=Streptomyces atrovirens TaxID=285556 RepID=A0ABW0DTF4_9ACTN